MAHTDDGTITLLVNDLGGLQVLEPGGDPAEENAWKWVRPEPGCLIVNTGDAMVEWTGRILRSNIHRIRHCPGEQRYVERYSVAVLVRPHKEASLRRLVGGRIPKEEAVDDTNEVTAFEWERRKAMMMLAGTGCLTSRRGRELAGEA